MSGLREDNSEAVREYLRALRPWVAILVLMAYIAPLLAIIAYDQTLSARDAMLFWLGSDKYAHFGLLSLALPWISHASVFAFTRFVRFRPLVLATGGDYRAFDRRSRECFIVWSVILGLYLALFCFLEWP